VSSKCAARGTVFDADHFGSLDEERRRLITRVEELRSRKKKSAKQIGVLKSKGEDTSALENETRETSNEIGGLEKKLREVEESFRQLMLNIPNLIDDTVPIGGDETKNRVIREWGEKPVLSFEPRPHWELGDLNAFLDLRRAAKISGARFALYFDALARLERVLINFMMDIHTQENGYREVFPPFLVNDQSLIGTGNLPKFKDDLFKIEDHNLYLVPTAEVPLTNIHRDEILDAEEIPKSYVAYTPCFRSEAGSHGKDVRGIIRQHQFNKVELLKFCTPETSADELERLTADAERILQSLGLHYRVVLLCSGDTSFSSSKTYDLEVWMPARGDYVEISSCSNFADFQARRSGIKYKKDGKNRFVHTLNGSGLAVGRTVAAILENYQRDDGKVSIPEILKSYFPGRDHL
jgi:seryl-tRNA synthetase